MKRGAPFVPLGVVTALVLLPSGAASHLSMDMPGLGGAAVPAPSFLLLAVTALAALLSGAWLLRPDAGRGRDAGWALALVPLAVSAARTSSLAATSGDLGDRIARLGEAGGEHMWALLATLALAVGFGAARVLELAIARPETPRLARAAAALALAGPFVVLVLATSTGVDWTSSWIRWGGVGLAILVCAGSAAVPDRGEARVLGGLTLVLAAALTLVAEREYVEALGHDALAHRDPFDPAVGWLAGVRQIAAAVEPRERYGLVLALLPWAALAPQLAWSRARPPLVAGVAVAACTVLCAHAISSRLDATAVPTTVAASTVDPPEITWSTRALPRTARWLPALRRPTEIEPAEPVPPVQCASWMAPTRP